MKMIAGLVFATVAAFAVADDKACCMRTAKNPDAEFLALAQEMTEKAEGKSTKTMMCAKPTKAGKAGKGCCGEMTGDAKFKVFVANEGYKFFGCSMSALEGRNNLLAKGHKVGNVQPVNLGRVR